MLPMCDKLMHEILNTFHLKIMQKLKGMITLDGKRQRTFLYNRVAKILKDEEEFVRKFCKTCGKKHEEGEL